MPTTLQIDPTKVKTFRVTFSFRGAKNALRQSSLVIDAHSEDEARKFASEQLSKDYTWTSITKISLFS